MLGQQIIVAPDILVFAGARGVAYSVDQDILAVQIIG